MLAAEVATNEQNAIWLTGTDAWLAQQDGSRTMWCGFCGAYTGAAKAEECPKECAPAGSVPLAQRELDPQGQE